MLGLLSGLISGMVCLVIAYLLGVIVIAIHLRDIFATLLASLTVLPLMIIFVLILPTALICIVLGLASGSVLNLVSRAVSLPALAIIGFILAELLMAVIVPMIATPSNGDFVAIVGNPYLAGIYGLVLGALTGCIFHWIARR